MFIFFLSGMGEVKYTSMLDASWSITMKFEESSMLLKDLNQQDLGRMSKMFWLISQRT